MKKALSVLTFSVNVKEGCDIKKLEELFEKFGKPLLKSLPIIQRDIRGFEVYFRVSGNKVSVDCVCFKEEFLQSILDLGINASDFLNLKASFNQNSFQINFSKGNIMN